MCDSDVTWGAEAEAPDLEIFGEHDALNPILTGKNFKLHTDAGGDLEIFFIPELSTNGALSTSAVINVMDNFWDILQGVLSSLKIGDGKYRHFTKLDNVNQTIEEINTLCKNAEKPILCEYLRCGNQLQSRLSRTRDLYNYITKKFRFTLAGLRAQKIISVNEWTAMLEKKPDIISNKEREIMSPQNIELITLNEQKNIFNVNYKPTFEDVERANKMLQDLVSDINTDVENYKKIIDSEQFLDDANIRNSIKTMDSFTERLKNQYFAWGFIEKELKNNVVDNDINSRVLVKFNGRDYKSGNSSKNIEVFQFKTGDFSIALQLSVQLKVEKVPDLFQFYIDYKENIKSCDDSTINPGGQKKSVKEYCFIIHSLSMYADLYTPDKIGLLHFAMPNIPILNYQILASNIDNVLKETKLYDKEGAKIDKLFNEYMKIEIPKIALTEEEISKGDIDYINCKNFEHAKGLAQLTMFYIYDLFHGDGFGEKTIGNQEYFTSQIKKNWYGPKMSLKFMSRNSFYALYSRMDHCNKAAFKEFHKIICAKDLCKNMWLAPFEYHKAKYYSADIKYGHYDNTTIVNLNLNLDRWLTSIYANAFSDNDDIICALRSDSDITKAAVTVTIDDLIDKYFMCEQTDLLSPPMPMRWVNSKKRLSAFIEDSKLLTKKHNEILEIFQKQMQNVYSMGAYIMKPKLTNDPREKYVLLEMRQTSHPQYLKLRDLKEFIFLNVTGLEKKIATEEITASVESIEPYLETEQDIDIVAEQEVITCRTNVLNKLVDII